MPKLAKTSLVLFFLSLCAGAFIFAHRVRPRVPVSVPHDLFAVVNQQLAAFRAADFPSAYRYAATGVQQKFTLAQFEAMVRQTYADMTSAQRVEFGSVTQDGGVAQVQVFLFAVRGAPRAFVYTLVAEGAEWKIESVEQLGPYHSHTSLAGTHA